MPAEPQKRPAIPPDFRVGDWLVEPSLSRISHNGAARQLRPQLIDLLALLARHAGRTVAKDVILAEVWQRQHVAESGLTRCITEIRQALGDDAHAPWLVQTIPKRGYRLVAPVEFLDTNALADTAALPATPRPEAETIAAPPASRRRVSAIGPTAGSVLGIMLFVVALWVALAWRRVPVDSGRDTILLADVANTTGDKAFDTTLKLALALHLGRAPSLRILSGGRLRASPAPTDKPADQPVVGAVALEVCRREGASILLATSIGRFDTHYALGIEAIACRTGETIARELVEVEGKGGVLTGLETAAARLRRKIGESRALRQTKGAPIALASPPTRLRFR